MGEEEHALMRAIRVATTLDQLAHSSIAKQRTEYKETIAATSLPGSLCRIRVRSQGGERFSLAPSFGRSHTQSHGIKSLTW